MRKTTVDFIKLSVAPTCIDHFIDFWVIFSADLAAAYVALTWFEAKKEDRAHARQSLNELSLLAGTFIKKYRGWHERFRDSSDSTATGLSRDINDEDRRFAGLANDGAFWSFKGSTEIRSVYNEAQELKVTLSANTVGEARQRLSALIEQMNKLKTECDRQMG